TSIGETVGVVNLCRMFFQIGQTCGLQQSRLVNLEEIKANNAILLGGNQSWSGWVFLNVEGFHFQGWGILNRKPLPESRPCINLSSIRLRINSGAIMPWCSCFPMNSATIASYWFMGSTPRDLKPQWNI